MHMPYYEMSDQAQLFVREVGQGEPILILSGLGMQSWQWLPFILSNLKQYRFIIPDWRGFAGSKHCEIPQDLDAIRSHWRDIECLIDQMQLDHFKLIAYSMGATTAMHGMQYGQLKTKIKSYLHIDQSPKIACDHEWSYGLLGRQYPQFIQCLQSIADFLTQHQHCQKLNQLTVEERQQLLQLWLSFVELQQSNRVSPLLFKLASKQPKLQQYLLPIQRLDYMAWYINNYLYHVEDYRDAISQLDCPTTFFIGEQSSLYPVQGQLRIAASVKNAHKVIFKQSGHTPLITEPVKFRRELQAFLRASSSY